VSAKRVYLECPECGEEHGRITWDGGYKGVVKLHARENFLGIGGTYYVVDVYCDECGSNRPLPKAKLYADPMPRKVLRAVEARGGRKIQCYLSPDGSGWNVADFVIAFGPRVYGARYDSHWKHRIPYHELGHAMIDMFYPDFDKKAYREIFHGGRKTYRVGWDSWKRNPVENWNRPSITAYGKTHPEEAWAEAFSFALTGYDCSDEKGAVIRQIEYANWVIGNVVSRKRSWGKFE
jgi:hypothetical protein